MAEANILTQVAQTVAGEMEKALDAEIERLDNLNEDDYEQMRKKRIEEMRKDAQNKQKWKREGHGKLMELSDEKEFFDLVKRSPRVIALFARAGNKFADDLKEHLAVIAEHHFETRIVVLDAEKSPFLVQRLKIWMIPSMVLIIDQKTNHTISGLDEISGDGKYPTWHLERLLNTHNVLTSHVLEDRHSSIDDDEEIDWDA
uniref:Thioredoxin domain-containing protein n=1 Tax=Paramoeba aestuarina TaxID=180227 RepID=A0A7S4PLQ9_9EUKA|eukprot:CAMPEP_0201521994 /NCGR_PEP_ID=MMETSP0161_2-20130828/16395_1 /ASSEMBLY_ACC=CAM_ASM_000251 /TAXON_ID=180227 /ORGANISM="Neoparamoeba aestuarina, Strain SoJaBio B1-5/56/2" /LENGTH=200 /DNA_ID=CAMNT_0047920741 /DNA_START=24 /DNA_END=626 /DNA_ORIENTATION=+